MISLHLKSSTEHSWLNTEGKFNRLNGFADKLLYENGQLCCEGYYIDGKRHNQIGPAFRHLYKNGQLWWEEYWLEGNQVDKSTLEKFH